MRIGSLFAGIGGLELGLEWAGVGHTVWQVEREPFCQRVLAQHWPDAQRFDDVTTVGAHNLPPVDVICGGFPCQDISYAGKGAGLAGARSGLWYEFARIVRELEPRFVVVENVSALLTRGLDAVLGTLASLGYDAEWSCVRASDVGARHRRERVFVIAWMADPRRERRGSLVREIDTGNGNACERGAEPIGAHCIHDLGNAHIRGIRRGEAPGEGGYAALANQVVDDANFARLEGRSMRRFRRADERTARAAGGEELADAGCIGSERHGIDQVVDGSTRESAGQGLQRQRDGDAAGGGGSGVADGDGERLQGSGAESEISKRAYARRCRPQMAHGDGGGCEVQRLGGLLDGQRALGGNDADRRGRAWDSRGRNGEQVDQGHETQPRMGRAAHGLSARLDVARPGEPQADWEAPRVVTHAQDRAARLKALGNAVVPQVAEVVGRRLLEIAEREGLL